MPASGDIDDLREREKENPLALSRHPADGAGPVRILRTRPGVLVARSIDRRSPWVLGMGGCMRTHTFRLILDRRPPVGTSVQKSTPPPSVVVLVVERIPVRQALGLVLPPPLGLKLVLNAHQAVVLAVEEGLVLLRPAPSISPVRRLLG